MNDSTRASRFQFTMVELIVVVAIIGILAAILLPALNKAIAQAKRLNCASNQHQSWMACQLYADEMDDVLPLGFGDAWPIGIFKYKTVYDLRWYLDGYINDYRSWVCTTVDNAPMDDPRNTRNSCYTPWYYYPKFTDPDFGIGGVPIDTRLVSRPETQPMIQDQVVDLTATGVGFWRYNHGKGEILNYGPDDPSLSLRYGVARQLCFGANISYFDGHTAWVPVAQMEPVGHLSPTNLTSDVYSTLPEK